MYKKLSIVIGCFCAILLVFGWIKTRDNIQVYTYIDEDSSPIKNVKKEPIKKNIVDDIYKRKKPIYKLTTSDITSINKLTSNPKKLKLWIKQFKKSNKVSKNSSVKTNWNIYTMPSSQKEYKLWMEELSIKMKYHISVAIKENNIKNIILASQAYTYIKFLEVLKLKGYGEDGNLVLEFKGLDNIPHRKLASETKTKKLLEFNNSSDDSFKQIDAFFAGTQEDLAGDDIRRKLVSSNFDRVGITSLLDKISDFLGEYGLSTTNREKFTSNISLIEEVMNNQKKVISDPVDLGMNPFIQQIIHEKAFMASMWGSAIATFFKNVLSKILLEANATISHAISAIGISTVFSILYIYNGLHQVYYMRVIYNYIYRDKFKAKLKGNTFNYRDSIKNISFDNIDIISEYKKEILFSWILSMAFGSITSHSVDFITNLFKTRIERKVLAAKKRAVRFGSNFLKKINIFSNSIRTTATLIANLRPKTQKYISNKDKTRKNYVRLRNFFSLRNLTYLSLGFVSFAVVNYILTYTILYRSSRNLFDVQLMPGTNIQLALLESLENNNELLDISRNILYPLCTHFAHKNGKKVLANKEQLRNRSKACLDIIRSIEGYNNNNKIKEEFPEIYQGLTATNSIDYSNDEFNNLLEQLHHYEREYYYFVTSAIRSIYPLHDIPSRYWDMLSYISEKSNERNIVSSMFNSNQAKVSIEIDLLNRSIENLSVEIFRQKYFYKTNKMIEKNNSLIVREIVSLHHEWIRYVDFQKYLLKKGLVTYIDNQAKYLDDKTNDSSFVDDFFEDITKISSFTNKDAIEKESNDIINYIVNKK